MDLSLRRNVMHGEAHQTKKDTASQHDTADMDHTALPAICATQTNEKSSDKPEKQREGENTRTSAHTFPPPLGPTSPILSPVVTLKVASLRTTWVSVR